MRIQESNVFLSGQYRHEQLSLRALKADIRQTQGGSSSHGVRLTLNTQTSQQQKVSSSSQVQDTNSFNQYDARYFAQQVTQAITHHSVSINQWHGQLQEARQGQQIEIESIQQVNSLERLMFEARGQVKTTDGRSIDFMLELDFGREITEEQSAYFKGTVQLADPLMINLNGGAITLTNQYFDFDLFSDGSNARINKTAQGSGYLVFDRNADGIVNDGSEMFGPQTGNGFEELRQYDSDGNGWIDENDDIFSQLGVLTFNEQGEAVYTSALDAELGALYLGSIGSNYALLDDEGELIGRIRQNGVALSEDGKTLLLQEIHLRYELDQQAQKNANSSINLSNSPRASFAGTGTADLSITRSAPMSAGLFDIRQQISASMRNFSLEAEQANAGMSLIMNSGQFSVTLKSERPSLEVEDTDGKLSQLRQTVEILKKMQEAQKLRQQGQQPLGIYHFVHALKA